MEKLTASKKIEKAKVSLFLDAPFWTTTIYKLEFIEDREGTKTRTMATDGKVIYYFPPFVDSIKFEECKGVIVHEGNHVIFLHPYRRGTRDFKKWNVACDYAINLILHKAGFTLPQGGLINAEYEGMTAEQIYNLIPDPPPGQPNQPGEVLDHPGTPEEKAQDELKQRLSNVQTAQIAKKAGNLPEGMERIIEDLNAPKINIKEIIGRFVEMTSKNDFTWKRPNRRYMGEDIYLPALESPELGHLAFLVDMSGSVTDEQAKDLLSVIKGTLEIYRNAELSIIFFATSASKPYTVPLDTEVKELKSPANIGSGTNYRPPFEMIRKENLDPVGIIVLTDGICHSFAPEPNAPTLWILTGRNDSFNPPYGETYLLETGDDEQ